MQAIELETTISPEGGIVLPPDCQAIYGRHARLILLLDDDPSTVSPTRADRAQRQAALRQALLAVAQAGTFAHIDDASAWQREARVDRALPGRED
ncbi:MAG: hypothetical protein CRU78_18025 [Candidatus Accumulibacter phosphatis]|jgi:hypothetical protein|uniref:Uncharacterized protein n=1 Tax=Candidatus Accumulibacter phosphatis TaxID=327160 RepID=A0A6A7RXT5_9PROT|nr:hypothetical protein [Candidatus Accumulibacter phosphatis]